MKKLLMMAFVSMAMLATVSCTKEDNDPTPEPATLAETQWECVHSFSIPVIGIPATVTIDLDFTTDTTVTVGFAMVPDLSSYIGTDIPSSGDFAYTFDGSVAVVHTESDLGDMTLNYADYGSSKMLIWVVPENYRQILGTSELVFHIRQ